MCRFRDDDGRVAFAMAHRSPAIGAKRFVG
jgi:hypothetical protein